MNDGSIGSTFKGRTSRGTMALMHDYAELINELRPTAEQFTEIEQYWVKRIQAFFTSKPFKLESDNSLSVDAAVEHLLRQAAQPKGESGHHVRRHRPAASRRGKAHHRCSGSGNQRRVRC